MPPTKTQIATKWRNIGIFGAVFVGCAVIGPATFFAIQGAIGLIIFGMITVLTLALAKPVGMMIANGRLKLLKLEASRNPVETLQNDFIKRSKDLAIKEQKIAIYGGMVKNMQDKRKKLQTKYGENDPPVVEYSQKVDAMENLYRHRIQLHRDLKEQLAEYEAVIEKASDIWEATTALAEATEGDFDVEAEFQDRLTAQTALASIQTSMNQQFAALEVEMAVRLETPQLKAIA